VDNDGDIDLFFADYDNGDVGDINDRLLLNQGNGSFLDASDPAHFQNTGWLVSGFGTRGQIADLNTDGKPDLLRAQAGNTTAIYQSSTQSAFFNRFQDLNGNAVYFASAGDLNMDGKLDVVVTSDGTDLYLINTGNKPDGTVNWATHIMPAQTGGFGANSVIADLDKDGNNDVIIVDVDVDIAGCDRVTDILRNTGGPVNNLFSYQSNNVGIGEGNLIGVHDVAVFDINNDSCLDLVMGRCSSTQVWIQQGCVAPCPTDLDNSGGTDQSDLGILLAAFGTCPGDAGHNAAAGALAGDPCVTQADLGVLLAAFGVSCP
jgi:hypothetical protein